MIDNLLLRHASIGGPRGVCAEPRSIVAASGKRTRQSASLRSAPNMKRDAFLIVVLLGSIASLHAGETGKTPLTLADRVRQSDVIAVADVREVKVANANETFEYQYVTCALTNFLKGKAVNNPAEVVLMLKLKQDPPPDRLVTNKSYLVFLTGDWSLQPLTPTGSIVPVADVNEKMLGEIRQLVKDGSPIRYVSLNVRMTGGWSADTKIHSGGKRTGGHMSGGPAPFHHMEEKPLGGVALSNVIAQAEIVFRSPVPSQPTISTNDLVYILIETFERETKTYQRHREGQFADKDLVELDKLLHQHRIGAW